MATERLTCGDVSSDRDTAFARLRVSLRQPETFCQLRRVCWSVAVSQQFHRSRRIPGAIHLFLTATSRFLNDTCAERFVLLHGGRCRIGRPIHGTGGYDQLHRAFLITNGTAPVIPRSPFRGHHCSFMVEQQFQSPVPAAVSQTSNLRRLCADPPSRCGGSVFIVGFQMGTPTRDVASRFNGVVNALRLNCEAIFCNGTGHQSEEPIQRQRRGC